MGTRGEFKEYQNTSSLYGLDARTIPPISAYMITSGTTLTGHFSQLYVVSASTMVAVSGSIGGTVNGQIWPTNTTVHGDITVVRVSSGIVIAYQ